VGGSPAGHGLHDGRRLGISDGSVLTADASERRALPFGPWSISRADRALRSGSSLSQVGRDAGKTSRQHGRQPIKNIRELALQHTPEAVEALLVALNRCCWPTATADTGGEFAARKMFRSVTALISGDRGDLGFGRRRSQGRGCNAANWPPVSQQADPDVKRAVILSIARRNDQCMAFPRRRARPVVH
jgi:hypothetical protein